MKSRLIKSRQVDVILYLKYTGVTETGEAPYFHTKIFEQNFKIKIVYCNTNHTACKLSIITLEERIKINIILTESELKMTESENIITD